MKKMLIGTISVYLSQIYIFTYIIYDVIIVLKRHSSEEMSHINSSFPSSFIQAFYRNDRCKKAGPFVVKVPALQLATLIKTGLYHRQFSVIPRNVLKEFLFQHLSTTSFKVQSTCTVQYPQFSLGTPLPQKKSIILWRRYLKMLAYIYTNIFIYLYIVYVYTDI